MEYADFRLQEPFRMSATAIKVDTDKLKIAMVRNGINTKTLAKGSGLSYETIRRVLKSGILQIKTAIKITQCLDIDIEEII